MQTFWGKESWTHARNTVGVTWTNFRIRHWLCVACLLFCLLVLLLERVLGSYDRKGHLCPSGSRVHWALAEKRVGLHSSSPAGWYPVCAPACIPSVCHSVAWRQLSTPVKSPHPLPHRHNHPCASLSDASLPLIIFPFLFLKQVNTHHLPILTLLSWKCSSHWHNDKSAYKLPGEGVPLALRRKQWIVTEKQDWPQRWGMRWGHAFEATENNELEKGKRNLLWAKCCNHPPPLQQTASMCG